MPGLAKKTIQVNKLEQFAQCFRLPLRQERNPSLIARIDELSLEESYQVQDFVVRARMKKGDSCVGYKIGCTSQAIRNQFNLREPICGRLLSNQIHRAGSPLRWDDYSHLAVEPEFVFRFAHDLSDRIRDERQLEDAIEAVGVGIELHHYKFLFGQATIQELIASNGIHAGLVVGPFFEVGSGIDWNECRVTLSIDGQLQAEGSGQAIMGGPLRSVAWLANRLLDQGSYLRRGDWVIPGSPVELISVQRGERVESSIEGLGVVDATFV